MSQCCEASHETHPGADHLQNHIHPVVHASPIHNGWGLDGSQIEIKALVFAKFSHAEIGVMIHCLGH